MNKHLPSLM